MGTPWRDSEWVADASRYNPAIWSVVAENEPDLKAVIVQLHRGMSPDPLRLKHLTEAREAGLLIGVYAYPWWDQPTQPQLDLTMELLDEMRSELGDIGDVRPHLDLEGALALADGVPDWLRTEALAAGYLRDLEREFDVEWGQYCNRTWAHNLRFDELPRNRLWLAAYLRNDQGYPVPCRWRHRPPPIQGGTLLLTADRQTPDKTLSDLWQCTSTRTVEGVYGNTLDMSTLPRGLSVIRIKQISGDDTMTIIEPPLPHEDLPYAGVDEEPDLDEHGLGELVAAGLTREALDEWKLLPEDMR